MDVDGEEQFGIRSEHGGRRPPGPDNPHGNAFYAQKPRLLANGASEAQRVVDPMSGRYWVVSNPVGAERAWGGQWATSSCPAKTYCPLPTPDASIMKRAGFMTEAPVGHALRPRRNIGHGPVPQPAPGRRGPARVHEKQPERGGHRRGALVHAGLPPRAPSGGLADFTSGLLRVQPQARRVLRHQPGAGRASQRPLRGGVPHLEAHACPVCHREERSDVAIPFPWRRPLP